MPLRLTTYLFRDLKRKIRISPLGEAIRWKISKVKLACLNRKLRKASR